MDTSIINIENVSLWWYLYACTLIYLSIFETQFLKKLSNTEAELKNSVAYKKSVYFRILGQCFEFCEMSSSFEFQFCTNANVLAKQILLHIFIWIKILRYNTISLSCHEQVCLSVLRFERYFSHHRAKWWEKYLSKHSPLKHTCSWHDKLIVLWILNRQAKISLCTRFYSTIRKISKSL